jgi:uncharacterized protein (DUF362 family)
MGRSTDRTVLVAGAAPGFDQIRMSRRNVLRLLALGAGSLLAACVKHAPVGQQAPQAALTPEPSARPATEAVPPTALTQPTQKVTLPTAVASPAPTFVSQTTTPAPQDARFFNLHPFIQAHPEAVFIERTNVEAKTDDVAKRGEGQQLARELFALDSASGIPLSHLMAVKANVTCTSGKGNSPQGMGIITDVHFVEGVINGLKGLGFPADRIHLHEGNWLRDGYCAGDLPATGYPEMAQRAGIHLFDLPGGRDMTQQGLDTLKEGEEIIWKDVPDGVVFRRIGYVAPYNQADSWLLNIAKFKAHGMGMTLSVKNLQGMCVSPHVHFCEGVSETLKHPAHIRSDFQPDLQEQVADLHAQHLEAGIPRWDRPGRDWNSGYGMEMWAQRTCDSMSVTKPGLSIIEGIYGRNGNGFLEGPGPGGVAQDFMANLLIFGVDPFRVDIIGTWLAGHEPGNMGLFHIARERGLSAVVNPMEIPVYRWGDGEPQLTSLTSFERVPLRTYYLQQDYGGQRELKYHMLDQPYSY